MSELRIIKRYANRKLYDTGSSRYVTLKDLAELVSEGEELRIVDNDSGEDITSKTLANVLLDAAKDRQRHLSLTHIRQVLQSGGTFLQRHIAQPVVQLRDDAERTLMNIRDETERQLKTLRQRSPVEEVRAALQEMVVQTQRSIDELQRRLDEGIRLGRGTGAESAGEGSPDAEPPETEPAQPEQTAPVQRPVATSDSQRRLESLEDRVAVLEQQIAQLVELVSQAISREDRSR